MNILQLGFLIFVVVMAVIIVRDLLTGEVEDQ